MYDSKPVIITGALEHWPALGKQSEYKGRAWKNIEYLRKVAGFRTVPVEIGSSYLEDDWGQQLMTLNDFLDVFLLEKDDVDKKKTKKKVGYLAQHQLFEQV